ncbi:MAG: uroporphyrinogen-III synthase, partial [Actinomycetota bacterium]|nr:uroporphyrinogen-III synthase [Actinomycetota bacterium]
REQASELRGRLEALGAEVVEIPTIAIKPAEADLASHVPGADWVVLTSTNAVAQLCSQLHDARALATAKVAAVGPGTAETLRVFGVRADLVPERTVAEGLVEVFPRGNGRVFLPQAAGARPVVAEGLAAKGWTVDAVTAYSAVGVGVTETQRAAARGADAIAFTASSTVTNYLGAAGPGDVPPVVVCIGPVTAETAARHGLQVTEVAEPHTLEGLVVALQRALAR